VSKRFVAICCLAIGFGVGGLIFMGPEGTLPPCQTEDSTHCYWDASVQGNGLGHDFINP